MGQPSIAVPLGMAPGPHLRCEDKFNDMLTAEWTVNMVFPILYSLIVSKISRGMRSCILLPKGSQVRFHMNGYRGHATDILTWHGGQL